MSLLAFAAPILPGKTEQYKRFEEQLRGARNEEFRKSREKAGIRERSFLQSTPQGDFVIVTLEGDDPALSFQEFANSPDPFARWFTQQVKEIHGIDLTRIPENPLPKLVVDTGPTPDASGHLGEKGEANKAVVRRFLEEIVSSGGSADWDRLTTPDYRNYGFDIPLDRDGTRKLLSQFHTAFPDFRVIWEDGIAEGDRVAAQTTIHGTHRGDFQGIAPTGKQIAVPGVAVFRVKDGKVAEDKPVYDQMVVMQQLGVMPSQQRRAA